MDIPAITSCKGTREQAITDLIQSIALQETALSHILNAEGEKMQTILTMPNVTPEELLKFNKSVNQLINSLIRLEMMFQAKLEIFTDEL